jgi:hypothetical protein
MGGIRETLAAAALVSFALLPHQTLAVELAPFDASGCEDDGGWVVCPKVVVGGKILVLSHEEFQAVKTASPLSKTQLDQAIKAFQDK